MEYSSETVGLLRCIQNYIKKNYAKMSQSQLSEYRIITDEFCFSITNFLAKQEEYEKKLHVSSMEYVALLAEYEELGNQIANNDAGCFKILQAVYEEFNQKLKELDPKQKSQHIELHDFLIQQEELKIKQLLDKQRQSMMELQKTFFSAFM